MVSGGAPHILGSSCQTHIAKDEEAVAETPKEHRSQVQNIKHSQEHHKSRTDSEKTDNGATGQTLPREGSGAPRGECCGMQSEEGRGREM